MVANKLVQVQVADAFPNPIVFDDAVRADDTAVSSSSERNAIILTSNCGPLIVPCGGSQEHRLAGVSLTLFAKSSNFAESK